MLYASNLLHVTLKRKWTIKVQAKDVYIAIYLQVASSTEFYFPFSSFTFLGEWEMTITCVFSAANFHRAVYIFSLVGM